MTKALLLSKSIKSCCNAMTKAKENTQGSHILVLRWGNFICIPRSELGVNELPLMTLNTIHLRTGLSNNEWNRLEANILKLINKGVIT